MNNLEKWLISIEPEKVIEEIQKRACSECPAAEYCKNSPLNFCTEVLYAWAKDTLSYRCFAPGRCKGRVVGVKRFDPYIPAWCPKLSKNGGVKQ